MKFETQKLTPDKYLAWNQFCDASHDGWFWHTTHWLAYILARKENKPRDLSFLVYQNKQLKAIVPLVSEIHSEKEKEFSFEKWALPAPALSNELSASEKDSVNEYIFSQIDSLAKQHKTGRLSLNFTPLAPNSLTNKNSTHSLIKFGFQDISLNTRFIDLNKTTDALWQELRRNHRRNILKVDQFKVIVYTHKNITAAIFKNYERLHYEAAGRKTRPHKTFALMYRWLKQGHAFLAVVEFNNRQIGFEYYSVYKNNVYGFSAANDPKYETNYPIRHLIEWQAILWMKKQGYSLYEIGLQQYGLLPYDFPDDKQLNISHFKKGFGGFEAPFLIAEKFFNKDYFLKISAERAKDYSNYLHQ